MPAWLFPLVTFFLGVSGSWALLAGRLARMETKIERLEAIEKKLDAVLMRTAQVPQ